MSVLRQQPEWRLNFAAGVRLLPSCTTHMAPLLAVRVVLAFRDHIRHQAVERIPDGSRGLVLVHSWRLPEILE